MYIILSTFYFHTWPTLAIRSQPILEPLARVIYKQSKSELRGIYERSTSDVRAMYKRCTSDLWAIYECFMDASRMPGDGRPATVWQMSTERSKTAPRTLVESINTWLTDPRVSTYRPFLLSVVKRRSYMWRCECPFTGLFNHYCLEFPNQWFANCHHFKGVCEE